MMATTTTLPQRINYATSSEQWEAHRDIIVHFYIVKQRTLNNIIEVMRDDYQFLATARQYKFHLAKWGVRKYAKRNDGSEKEGLRGEKKQMANVEAGDGSTMQIKTYTPPRAETHSSSKAPGKLRISSHAAATHRWKVTTPCLFSPAAPDSLRLPDQCMRVCGQYVLGAFSTGMWQTYPDADECVAEQERVLTWYSNIALGIEFFKKGKTKKAFSLWRDSFGRFPPLIKKPDPRLFIMMHLAAIYLSDVAPELAKSIYKFAAELCRINYGSKRHPLYLYLLFVSHMDNNLFRINARAIGECLMNLLIENMDPRSPIVPEVIAMMIQLNSFLAAKDIGHIEGCIESALASLGRLATLPQNTDFQQLRGRLYLINMYEELNRIQDAHDVMDRILESPEDKRQMQANPRCLIYLNHAIIIIARKENNPAPMLNVADRFSEVALAFLRSSAYDCRLAVGLLEEMEAFMREIEHIDEADKLRKDLDQALSDLEDIEAAMMPEPPQAGTGENDDEDDK